MSAELYENMSQAEIIAEMKMLMKVLEKKEKAQTKLVEKIEEKKVAAAPAKGVRPAQLDKNAKWVQYVHEHILDNGWEGFIHTERNGKGVADIEYPPSVLMGEAYVFKDTDVQPNLSHAMTLSKLYKVEKPELYAQFEAGYEPVNVEKPVAKPVRVSMTLEEKLAQKLEKEQEKKAEKAEKGKHCEDCGEPHKNRKDNFCSPCRLLRKDEQAKEVKVAPKAAKAVLPKIAKAVPVLKVANHAWVPPAMGETKRVMINGINYYVDHLNRVFPPNEEDMPDDCAGVYIPDTHTIRHENIPEDETN
jgi:hypothetical protein